MDKKKIKNDFEPLIENLQTDSKYQPPRILYKEPLEVIANVCPTGSGGKNLGQIGCTIQGS